MDGFLGACRLVVSPQASSGNAISSGYPETHEAVIATLNVPIPDISPVSNRTPQASRTPQADPERTVTLQVPMRSANGGVNAGNASGSSSGNGFSKAKRTVSLRLPLEDSDDDGFRLGSSSSEGSATPVTTPGKTKDFSPPGRLGAKSPAPEPPLLNTVPSPSESLKPPTTPTDASGSPVVSRKVNMFRKRSISWSQIASLNQVKNEAVDKTDSSVQGGDSDSMAPRRLWSGRSFASVSASSSFLGSPGVPEGGDVTPINGCSSPTPFTPRGRLNSSPVPMTPMQRRGDIKSLGDIHAANVGLLAAEEPNEGRFWREFSEAEKIGEGHFSVVFRARNKVDRCMYAVKRTKEIQSGRHKQVQEAFVLASMALEAEGCPNIVRYFSSWFEGGQLFIQMELCECSLREHLADLCKLRDDNPRCTERGIADVLSEVAAGLESMHNCGFAHLDIKPDNIMRGRGAGRWKIGDLGLAVASLGCGCDDLTEGDCRYLAKEVMQGNLSNLERADVFSLGMVAYELATNPRPLPSAGPEWQTLREGKLDSSLLKELSPEMVTLLASMIKPVGVERPSSADIKEHPLVQKQARSGVGSTPYPATPGSAESQEVRNLQRKLEELQRTAQENSQMADKYREEVQRKQEEMDRQQEELNRLKNEKLTASTKKGFLNFGDSPVLDVVLMRSRSM